MKRRCLKNFIPIVLILLAVIETSCGKSSYDRFSNWNFEASLDDSFLEEELYEKALSEDVLIVYTVSTRVTKVKEAFEKKYPGLSVEVRDLRSPDLIEAVSKNYENGGKECDVVICNDNSGALKKGLVDKGIIVKYVPSDIADKFKKKGNCDTLSFLDEAELLFYNGAKFDSSPIENIWELTDEKYKGAIYIPSPLRSFSTYAFCGTSLKYTEEFEEAYCEYFNKEYEPSMGENASEEFWKMVMGNVVFTNSSDEVAEALLNEHSSADFGIMVSSKLRMADVGYSMKPIYNMKPFSGCRSSFSVMLAKGAPNVNTAKLFIHFILGEEDGKGEGSKPFISEGTWSVRSDVESGSNISLADTDIIDPDEDYLLSNEEYIKGFFEELLQESK